jgi:uncharacterized protein (TIGR02246 family)
MTDIAELEAYVAISQVKARYCRTLDTKDWAGYADVFTEDLVMDMSQAGGAMISGRDAAMRMVRGAVEAAYTAHQVHSPEIKLDGDTADVVWAMQDRVVWGAERARQLGYAGHTGYGHYHEKYVRKDGRWRIASQRLTRLHMDYYSEPTGDVPKVARPK